MSSASNNPGNFANRPKEEVQAIASKGGHASGSSEHKYNTRSNPTSDESTGGGTHSEAAAKNPHNFANMPKEEVQHLGHLGGKARAEQTHAGKTGGAQQAQQSQDVDLSLPGKDKNFHNRPKEEVREIAHMGGVASGEKRREQAEE